LNGDQFPALGYRRIESLVALGRDDLRCRAVSIENEPAEAIEADWESTHRSTGSLGSQLQGLVDVQNATRVHSWDGPISLDRPLD
jgi:hypothetical protein